MIGENHKISILFISFFKFRSQGKAKDSMVFLCYLYTDYKVICNVYYMKPELEAPGLVYLSPQLFPVLRPPMLFAWCILRSMLFACCILRSMLFACCNYARISIDDDDVMGFHDWKLHFSMVSQYTKQFTWLYNENIFRFCHT